MNIWGVVVLAIVLVIGFAIWFIRGVFKSQDERRENLEHRMEIDNGVIKNNVKADNSLPGSDLDNRVRKKYGSR